MGLSPSILSLLKMSRTETLALVTRGSGRTSACARGAVVHWNFCGRGGRGRLRDEEGGAARDGPGGGGGGGICMSDGGVQRASLRAIDIGPGGRADEDREMRPCPLRVNRRRGVVRR